MYTIFPYDGLNTEIVKQLGNYSTNAQLLLYCTSHTIYELLLIYFENK